jgi:hypothetical protein
VHSLNLELPRNTLYPCSYPSHRVTWTPGHPYLTRPQCTASNTLNIHMDNMASLDATYTRMNLHLTEQHLDNSAPIPGPPGHSNSTMSDIVHLDLPELMKLSLWPITDLIDPGLCSSICDDLLAVAALYQPNIELTSTIRVPDPPPGNTRTKTLVNDHEAATTVAVDDCSSRPPPGYGPPSCPFRMANRPVGLSPTSEDVRTLPSTTHGTTNQSNHDVLDTKSTENTMSIVDPYLGLLCESQQLQNDPSNPEQYPHRAALLRQ